MVPSARALLERREPPSGTLEPRNGTRQNPDNIRSRVLDPLRERAKLRCATERFAFRNGQVGERRAA
jgi:hypothetical protein